MMACKYNLTIEFRRALFEGLNNVIFRFRLLDNVDLMNRGHVSLQARLLSETVAAVVTGKLPFSSAFPFHVPPQVAQHRVCSTALLTDERRPHEICQMQRKIPLSESFIEQASNRTIGISRSYRFSDMNGSF